MRLTNFSRIARFAVILVTFGTMGLLSACGGSGGDEEGGGDDDKPDAFGFAGFDNVLPGFAYTSDAITVKGISDNVNLTLTVTGEGCEHSIDGGEFGSGETSVHNGQQVVLRLETPAEYDTEQSCTLDINGISADFTLKTGKNTFAMDAVPGHLEFSWSEFTGAESYRIQRSNHETGETEIVAEDIPGGADGYRLPVSVHLVDWVNDRYQLIACSGECNSLPGHEGELVQAMSVAAIGYLKASKAEADDYFGISVSLSGNRIAIGAREDGEHGYAAGAVYIFARNAEGRWQEQAKLAAADTDEFDLFGYDVALDGDLLAVYASRRDGGTVYMFEADDSGVFQGEPLAIRSGIGSTASLALKENRLVIGAPYDDSHPTNPDGSLLGSGAVYVHERDDNGEWQQAAFLKASNADAGAEFGFDVALDGDTLVVGARRESSNPDPEGEPLSKSGAAYVFERDANGEWQEVAFLKASNAQSDDNFGHRVALNGNTLVVGAPDEKSNPDPEGEPLNNSGAAYVFERNENGEWPETAVLKANNADMGDEFGHDVALNGNFIAVSAYEEGGSGMGLHGDAADNTAEDSGAVYLFKRMQDGSWQQQRYIKASNTGADDSFGTSIALDGERLVVGARYEDGGDDSIENSGAVYVY